MIAREPFTEPFPFRERLSIRVYWARHDIGKWLRYGVWQSLAHKLPRRLAYFAYVRVMAHAWAEAGNKHPDELTYREVCERWGEDK